ncbi:DUF3159 domain-containing protein [Mycolicibacterium sp. 624]|uniref:DUF3159 domain-containing protein n=1 Tax=Mycolicibacterium sp. 624 TaxID=3156314 RepID=UPI0033954614
MSGLVYSSAPHLAYVIVNVIADLNAAALVSICVGIVLTAVRIVRMESVRPASCAASSPTAGHTR